MELCCRQDGIVNIRNRVRENFKVGAGEFLAWVNYSMEI